MKRGKSTGSNAKSPNAMKKSAAPAPMKSSMASMASMAKGARNKTPGGMASAAATKSRSKSSPKSPAKAGSPKSSPRNSPSRGSAKQVEKSGAEGGEDEIPNNNLRLLTQISLAHGFCVSSQMLMFHLSPEIMQDKRLIPGMTNSEKALLVLETVVIDQSNIVETKFKLRKRF